MLLSETIRLEMWTAEGAPFSRSELDDLLALAERGIGQIIELQQATVGEPPPSRR